MPHYQKFISKTRTRGIAGGGIGFFVREGCEYEVLNEPSIYEERVHESLFIRVKGKNGGVVIGNVYRPNTAPYANINKSTQHLSRSIDYVRRNFRNDSIVIVGDFNVDLLGED